MIKEQLLSIQDNLPNHVTLVAVSKLNSVDRVMQAYDAGQRIFGENRVQELLPKYEEMPKDIQWHLIGHLQTNKVKFIAPFISMIHSIDSLKLLIEVNKQAKKLDRKIPVLLQFHVAQEETKFGLTLNDAIEILNSDAYKTMENIQIVGVMGMATFTNDSEEVRNEFKRIKAIFNQLQKDFFSNDLNFKEISMGMSHDYEIAIEEGSTIIRVGSKIFK